MDNIMNETEVNQSFRSPPRRRRSTFFERRDSIVPTITDNVEQQSCKTDTNDTKRSQDLMKYYEKLLVEKEQWKKEVNDRRNKYHDLRQQYQISVKASSRSRMSYAALTNEDIEFLKAKPNISKLADAQQKLHKSVKETVALVKRMNELDDVVLKHSENIVNTITEYILENSTVEPMAE
ncbi:uncharacterized protein LOC115453559 [Manduca sexta]|uniref:Uncharacterized protein n=1 Tax=Manduca sexta TaxID=7130 RepID=A0A921ZWX8_MANSE|nr:uncharacterized protein LOC115453559 [Manduca sexta]KAG6465089.1 hypothetical protein O3G_MSEX014923 [Manduca sexta]